MDIIMHEETFEECIEKGKKDLLNTFGVPVYTTDNIPKDKAYLINREKLRTVPRDIIMKTVKYYDMQIRGEENIFKKLDLIKEKYNECTVNDLLDIKWYSCNGFYYTNIHNINYI